jgi:hypothetical protein
MGTSNGVNQHGASLILASEGILGSDTWSLVGRTSVDPVSLAGNAINIVFIGQSTNNNAVNAVLTPFVLANPNNVYTGNIANPVAETVLYRAKEPLLASDLVSGHHGMNLGDALVSAGNTPNVVLWLAAFGGSYTGNFVPHNAGRSGTVAVQPDYLSWRIGLVARAIYAAGLDVNRTIIDYQHGEWDTDAQTTRANVGNNILFTAQCLQYWGLLRTGNVMFVHLNSRISGLAADRDAVRGGESDATDGVLIRLGADIDTLPASPYRYDGTHFNTLGAAAQAALKLPFYQDFLTNG